MVFAFSRQGLSKKEQRLERALEILPGATSWSILIGMTVLACWKPLPAAIIIIAFDWYWLLRLWYMTVFLLLSSFRLAIERETDWMARARQLETPAQAPRDPLAQDQRDARLRRRISEWIHQRRLRTLARSAQPPPALDALHHLVIIPIATERREVFEAGLVSLTHQQFPTQRMVVILALEARASAEVQADVHAACAQYRDLFLSMIVVVHPQDLPGEARVKGANVTYAAKTAATWFADRAIPFEHVIVSCFDADTVVDSSYFSALTYWYLITPERTQASFQPIPVYHNNIWDVPGFARVLDIGASFFQLIEATHPEKLVTFSSHSMSFKALVDVGYWPVDMISDDSAIFWKAYIHYDGRYRVVPLYVTLSMDIASADTWWNTAASVYRQKRRWAWGVENIPIVFRAFLRARQIPLGDRMRHAAKLFEGHVAWATWAFLLSVIGWIPALVAGREFSSSVLYYSAPRLTMLIFRLATVVLVMTIVLSFCLLPEPPGTVSWWRRFTHSLEWFFVPLIAIGFSAVPALEAQTRLMIGRYMEFWVTEKRRNPEKSTPALSASIKTRIMPVPTIEKSRYAPHRDRAR